MCCLIMLEIKSVYSNFEWLYCEKQDAVIVKLFQTDSKEGFHSVAISCTCDKFRSDKFRPWLSHVHTADQSQHEEGVIVGFRKLHKLLASALQSDVRKMWWEGFLKPSEHLKSSSDEACCQPPPPNSNIRTVQEEGTLFDHPTSTLVGAYLSL